MKDPGEETGVGLRIGKYIGWGLTDLKHEGMGLTDPRINPASHLLNDRPPDHDYLDLLLELSGKGDEDAELERMMLRELTYTETGLSDPVTWDGEYGDPAVMVIRPAGFPHWSRYSDAIDTEEHFSVSDRTEPVWRHLPGGVFPFSGLWMDARTGQKLDTTAAGLFRRLLASKRVTHERNEVLKRLAAALKFPDLAAAEAGVVPLVPGEIIRLARWGQLFTREDGWRDLRPVFYSYWS